MESDEPIFFEDGHEVEHVLEVRLDRDHLQLLEMAEREHNLSATALLVGALDEFASGAITASRPQPARAVRQFARELRQRAAGSSATTDRGATDAWARGGQLIAAHGG